QTSQDLSCIAANAQSPTRKALAPCSDRNFLRPQHIVFPQNGRKPAIRCEREKITSLGRKQKFAVSPLHAVLVKPAIHDLCLAKSKSIG
ncbi:MAG: hypothetical protein AAFU69_13940, partial [Pseudomonadota bacterium]